MSKGTGFIKGALVGAIAGVTAGVLFAPKAGKETREDIKNKALELKATAEKTYENARKAVERKVAELKKVGKQLSMETYEEIVNGVVEEMKNDSAVTKEVAQKLKAQLKSDYNKVAKALQA